MHWLPITDIPILIETGSNSSLEISPDIAEAALIAGYAHRDSGAGVAAETSFRAARSADPANGEARGALADLLSELERWEEAAGHYRAAADLEPFRTDWQYGLADAFTRIGDGAAALDVCNRLLERRPDNTMAHRALARIHAATDRHTQAIEHFREALFLDSAMPIPPWNWPTR
jgi:protein O-GlcNAc transferase